jgi:hypothetical protein
MSTTLHPPAVPEEAPRSALPAQPEAPARRPVTLVVVGLFAVAAGVAWLLDELGVSVAWALAPALGAVVVGLALIVTAREPVRRGPLVALGAALVVVAAVLTAVGPVHGPVGYETFAPTSQQWPTTTSMTAGNFTLDLTRHALPPSGTYGLRVGAGNVVVVLPRGDDSVRVVVHVGMGEIRVDGVSVDSGMDADWSAGSGSAVADVDVGMGQVDVRHQ